MSRSCGVIGYGRIGRLIEGVLGLEGSSFDLKAVADVSASSTAAAVANFKDYRDLLATDVAAVAIATPAETHFQIAADALRAGKDVLVEKPACRSVEDARHLEALAAERNAVIFFAYHARYNPAVLAAASYLCKQKVRSISVEFRENVTNFHGKDSWVHGEGVLRDSGINAFSVALALLDMSLPVRLLSAEMESRAPGLGPSRASLRYLAGEIPLSFELDWEYMANEIRTIDVMTGMGSCRLDISGGLFLIEGAVERPCEPNIDMLQYEYLAMVNTWATHLDMRASFADTREIEMLETAERIGDTKLF